MRDISARELKGHNILAVERFWDNTRWMIEFSVLCPSAVYGSPGDEMRLFLTEDGYQAALQSQQRREIKIKRYARVIEGHTATGCSRDFREINFVVSKSLKHRLRVKTKKAKRNKNSKSPLPEKVLKSRTYQKFYGSYGGKPKVVAGVQIFPIYGCKFVTPRMFTREVNKYTPQGRQLIHKNLSTVHSLIQYLLETKEYGKSVEYNDNRISLMAGQNGKCAVTGEPLCIFDMECHHIPVPTAAI